MKITDTVCSKDIFFANISVLIKLIVFIYSVDFTVYYLLNIVFHSYKEPEFFFYLIAAPIVLIAAFELVKEESYIRQYLSRSLSVIWVICYILLIFIFYYFVDIKNIYPYIFLIFPTLGICLLFVTGLVFVCYEKSKSSKKKSQFFLAAKEYNISNRGIIVIATVIILISLIICFVIVQYSHKEIYDKDDCKKYLYAVYQDDSVSVQDYQLIDIMSKILIREAARNPNSISDELFEQIIEAALKSSPGMAIRIQNYADSQLKEELNNLKRRINRE